MVDKLAIAGCIDDEGSSRCGTSGKGIDLGTEFVNSVVGDALNLGALKKIEWYFVPAITRRLLRFPIE